MKRRCLKEGGREKAFWGALISGIAGLAGTLYSASESSRMQGASLEAQKRAQLEAAKREQLENSASSMNNYFATNAQQPEEEYVYKNGGRRKLRNAGVKITDGGPLVSSTGELIYPGQEVPPGTYRDLGPSHKQTNAQGKTGTGAKTVGGKDFETQGGETWVVDPNQVMIFSKDLKKGGISYADRAANGENPYYLEREQAISRKRHLRDGKSSHVGRDKALRGASFYTPDYIGLGANVLGSILSGAYASSAYDDILNNINYELPNYVEEAYVAGPTRVEDGAKKAAVIREDINARNDIATNTASANVGLGRNQQIGTNAMYELMKIADETRNKNIELRQTNAERQQQFRGRNAAARNAYYQKVAEIKNQQLATRLALQQSKLESNVGMIQGIDSSIGGFLQQGIDNYQAEQARNMQLASSAYGSAERASTLGYNFDTKTMKSLRDDASRIMNQYRDDTSETGKKTYNEALSRFNWWNDKLTAPYSNNNSSSFKYFWDRLFKKNRQEVPKTNYQTDYVPSLNYKFMDWNTYESPYTQWGKSYKPYNN